MNKSNFTKTIEFGIAHRTVYDVLFVIAVVLALAMPFVNQAFHVDDREFIAFGEAQLQDPFRFYLENYDYAGRHYDVFRTTHPPLVSSLIAVVMWFHGSASEVALHSVFTLFPIIAGVSMYALGRRFTMHPLAAALLMLTTAGFIVSSHTIMGDVPALALWLASIIFFIRGVDTNDPRLLAAASILITLAVLTAYQSLSLIPLLLFYLILKRRLKLGVCITLLIPIAIFICYALFLRVSSGSLPRFSYAIGILAGWDDIDGKIRALLVFMGAVSIFPVCLMPAFIRRRKDVPPLFLITLSIITLGIIVPVVRGTLSTVTALFMVVPLIGGATIIFFTSSLLFGAARNQFRVNNDTADDLFLSVWLLGVSFYVLVFLPYVSVRHLLPLFPPLIILFVRGIQNISSWRFRRQSAYLGMTAVITLTVAFPAAVADYRMADSYRREAMMLKERYAGTDEKVWFLGEFGFRYYMEREGFENLGVAAIAKPGDIVVQTKLMGLANIIPPPPKEYSEVVESYTIEDSFPVRLISPSADAGFYGHFIGPMPWMISDAPLNTYTIYRLQW